MKVRVLEEPELEFAGGGRHVDPRFGIAAYGPADLEAATAPRRISVGIIGTQENIDATEQWLTSLRDPIDGKSSERPGLWPSFPGFRESCGYRSEMVFDPRTQRPIPSRPLSKALSLPDSLAIDALIDLYLEELTTLVQDAKVDVVICHVPDELTDARAEDTPRAAKGDVIDAETVEQQRPAAFHDLLKARAMQLRVPLQLLRTSTYDPSRAGRQKRKGWKAKKREDDATVAWNFVTALYYKAGGTPWRLARESTDLTACYVGVAFFRTADGHDTATSVAQVYNQRGDGVVVRGGPAHRSTLDKQLHLTREDANRALSDALNAYKSEHRTMPARVIVHKTSAFDEGEREGMLDAADALGISVCELVWITNATLRLYRDGYHPPLRGTFIELARDRAALYTRGTVEWYETYPGMYVPRPIELRAAEIERSILEVSEELLALSKMNWNSARFDGRAPVTLRTARQVADIIKHLPSDAHLEPRYAYYM